MGYSVIWTMRGFAAGQGMVFVLSVLNKVYNLTRVGPIHCKSCLLSVRVLCPKQGNKIQLFCLTRVCLVLNWVRVSNPQGRTYARILIEYPPPPTPPHPGNWSTQVIVVFNLNLRALMINKSCEKIE